MTILVGTSVPVKANFGDGRIEPDKAVHLVLYDSLQASLLRGLSGAATAAPLGRHLLAFLMTTGFGLLDELHQLPIPSRDFDWADLLFDALGAALASGLLLLLKLKRSKA